MKADFGIKACKESVVFLVERLEENPILLLGEFTLRAKQDPFFNKKMIDALMEYIEEHKIRWND